MVSNKKLGKGLSSLLGNKGPSIYTHKIIFEGIFWFCLFIWFCSDGKSHRGREIWHTTHGLSYNSRIALIYSAKQSKAKKKHCGP